MLRKVIVKSLPMGVEAFSDTVAGDTPRAFGYASCIRAQACMLLANDSGFEE
jgi:hypothetical protein